MCSTVCPRYPSSLGTSQLAADYGAGILWMSYVLARFLNRRGFSAVARPLEVVGANWIGVSFLIFVCLLGTDLVTGFGLLLPRMAPALRGWALVASLALCAIAVVQARRAPVVRSYEVQLAHLPRESDGTVLVLATDLHLDRLLGGVGSPSALRRSRQNGQIWSFWVATFWKGITEPTANSCHCCAGYRHR